MSEVWPVRFCVITHLCLGEKHLRRRVGGGRWKMAPNSTRTVFRADDNLPVITVHMDTLALLVWPIGRYTVAPQGIVHVHPCQKSDFQVLIFWIFTKSCQPDDHILPHIDTSR